MIRKILLAAAAVAAAGAAGASVITAPLAAAIPFPAVNYIGPGPETFGGVTWSSTNVDTQGGSAFGYDGGYSFLDNGYSNAVLAGVNDSYDAYGVSDSMTFTFATPVSSVGAVLNWVISDHPATAAVYDTSDHLIESLTLTSGGSNLVTPNQFYGFSESGAVIGSFVLTDGYVAALNGLNDLGAAVPEPATWALMLFGFGGIGAALRSRRRAATSQA